MPLNNIARAAIEELRGFGVADLTPDEVVRLNDLGQAQLDAGRTRDGIRLSPAVRVGNVVLHSPSCAALDLLDRFVDEVPERLKRLLLPWLCAVSRDAAALARIITARDLVRALRRFRRHCTATPRELDDACGPLLGLGEFEETDATRAAILQTADLAATRYPGLGSAIREKCLPLLRQQDERLERNSDTDHSLWREIAVELGALTGVAPDWWYAEDHRAALIAYRRAETAAATRSGLAEVGGEGPSPALALAVANLRKEMAAIHAARQERNHAIKQPGS